MDKVNLPGFRSTFQRIEITIDDDNEKVRLFMAISAITWYTKVNSRTDGEECDEAGMSQTIETPLECERRKDQHGKANPNTAG